MNRMNTRPDLRVNRINKTDLISLVFIEAEFTEIILVMTEAEAISERGCSSFRGKPRDYNNKRGS